MKHKALTYLAVCALCLLGIISNGGGGTSL